jgi:hypothetical protein
MLNSPKGGKQPGMNHWSAASGPHPPLHLEKEHDGKQGRA